MHAFERAWHASDRTAFGKLAGSGQGAQDSILRQLEIRLKRKGITGEFPKLSDYNEFLIPRHNPQKVKAYWNIPQARIRTECLHVDGSWYLDTIIFKKRKPN